MADIAEIFVDEIWIPKEINEITESDLSCPMRCCGKNDMGPCHATMRVRFENERPHV